MRGRDRIPFERSADLRLLLPGGWEAFALPRTELAALEETFGAGAGPWIGQQAEAFGGGEKNALSSSFPMDRFFLYGKMRV